PEGQGGARPAQRLACDVLAGGRSSKGFATTLAPHEIFVQLADGTLPDPGAEIVVRLREGLPAPDVELRAVVSSRYPDGEVDIGAVRGIEARIVEAPPEYHALFAESVLERSGSVGVLIEIDADLPARRDPVESGREAAADPDLPAHRAALRVEPLVHAPPAPARGRADPSASSPPSSPSPSPPKASASAEPTETGDVLHQLAADGPFEGQSRRPRPARAATAIVVYDGDKLADVYRMLERLGVRPERARMSGPTRFQGWDLPPRLLVVDAQDALAFDWPQNLIHDGVVRIAVVSSASAVVGRMLRSQGFHYLVRRPLHEQALEVLLRHALHRGQDRRAEARAPLGIDARLRTGRWRWPAPCTLLELSPTGCRIITREDVPLLSTVRLGIGRGITRGRPIALRARVVRRRRDAAAGEWALALRFTAMPADQRGRIDDLLARSAIGPTSALVDTPPTRIARWWRARHGGRGAEDATRALNSEQERDVAGSATDPLRSPPERRHVMRAALDAEVLALDRDRARVSAVLAGRDLSTLGMRVESHPDLEVGLRIIVAFYDHVSRGMIEISAEVVRDDGGRGLGIRFLEMSAECAARLERLVATLPTLESLLPHAHPIMVARIRPDPRAKASLVVTPTPASAKDDPRNAQPPPPAPGGVVSLDSNLPAGAGPSAEGAPLRADARFGAGAEEAPEPDPIDEGEARPGRRRSRRHKRRRRGR
ncbi:MAG TPA: PilZ domain-containing protein, partial [Alphaproteobacteria bacterium]|nr:PilZ domain-containing protein [Alphaproteobacteria bacterium]